MFNLQSKVRSLEVGRLLESYTGVVVHAGRNSDGAEVEYTAGNNSGYVLDVDIPSGTQEMANNILASLKLRGFRYQAYEADGAFLDPSVEIGDAISVNGTDGLALNITTRHSRLMSADVSAPYDEEVDHEFTYEPRATREFKRESAYTRARLTIAEDNITAEVVRATSSEETLSGLISINATNIMAKVSKSGGSSASFGWNLTDSSWSLFSGSKTVLSADSNGLNIEGAITATGGTVGGWEITDTTIIKQDSTHIVYLSAPNSPTDTNIAMAVRTKSNNTWTYQYYIRYSGELYAKNATIEGKVTATSGTIGGVTIANGVLSGISDTNIASGGISGGGGAGSIAAGSLYGGSGGDIGSSTISTWNTISGINTNLGYAAGYGAAIVAGTSSYPAQFTAGVLYCGTLSATTGLSVSGTGGASFSTNLTVQGAKTLKVTGQSTFQIDTGSTFSCLGYTVSWKSLRYVSDVIGGVPEYTTVYYLGR